jgi:hypothetical protein
VVALNFDEQRRRMEIAIQSLKVFVSKKISARQIAP